MASIESLMAALGPDEASTRASLNFDELVTLQIAADRLGRPVKTVGSWLSEGRFTVRGHYGRAALVSWGDVVEAEYQARTRRRRARPPALTDPRS